MLFAVKLQNGFYLTNPPALVGPGIQGHSLLSLHISLMPGQPSVCIHLREGSARCTAGFLVRHCAPGFSAAGFSQEGCKVAILIQNELPNIRLPQRFPRQSVALPPTHISTLVSNACAYAARFKSPRMMLGSPTRTVILGPQPLTVHPFSFQSLQD